LNPNQHRKRLAVINGDDFGFSSAVNQAIIQAHLHGVLTSASLMVTGDAFQQAVDLARLHPTLAVGLHLVLCSGRSALPPDQIPHLVSADGWFPADPLSAGLRYQFSRAARHELADEIRAQLDHFRSTGIPLSHVDGHLHLHVHPVVLRTLVELAAEYNIRFIRLPYEELRFSLQLDSRHWIRKLLHSLVFRSLRRHGSRLLSSHGISYAERVYGLLQTGMMTETFLLGLLPQIQSDRVEIYSHPALTFSPESESPGSSELMALTSERVRQRLSFCGFQLASFYDLL
jgi:hopanoid biosynthesis associated protein HpnK